jgi:alkylation response protein AidB-like acyl-CoA dehydrogenase
MFVKVETARQLSRATVTYNSGTFPPGTLYSISSKVYCTQAAFEVASDAIQLHGGYGLTKEMLVEMLFRDARASMIEDGSNDILSLTAAHKILDAYAP